MKVTFNEFKDADRIFIVASIKIGEYSSFKSRVIRVIQNTFLRLKGFVRQM